MSHVSRVYESCVCMSHATCHGGTLEWMIAPRRECLIGGMKESSDICLLSMCHATCNHAIFKRAMPHMNESCDGHATRAHSVTFALKRNFSLTPIRNCTHAHVHVVCERARVHVCACVHACVCAQVCVCVCVCVCVLGCVLRIHARLPRRSTQVVLLL